MEQGSLSQEQLTRKLKSEKQLEAEEVPYIYHLPVIEKNGDFEERTKEEIAYRALSLLVVALKGEGMEQDIVESIVNKYGLKDKLTQNEKLFIWNEIHSEQDKINALWRYESAWTLLWALGYIEELDTPNKICDVPKAVSFMRERTASSFINDSKLRAIDEILDQADIIYRYHWAVVDARVNGRETPAGLNPSLVMERHYALNWLIKHMDQEWDDISTDT